MEGPTSSCGSRNRITCLTLQEYDDDDDDKYTMMCKSNAKKNFIVFFIVLGQHVSILIESSSGPSKIQILTWKCLKCAVGSQTLTFLI